MKINKFYLIATMLFFLASNAQIAKGNWMMGGDASFSHNKRTDNISTSELTGFGIAPDVGYFFIDKLAVGVSGALYFTFATDYQRKNFTYGIAPFVRYYFLEKEKPLNIFSEMSYGFSTSNSPGNNSDPKIENFKAKVGAVYFLNSSVGLEIALNYLNNKYIESTHHEYDVTNNTFFLGVGFQIHLEKE